MNLDDTTPLCLLETRRSILSDNWPESLTETWHSGWGVVVSIAADNDKTSAILHQTPGATSISTFFRSCAKPFQAWPLLQAGLHHQLTEAELALCCASHVASAEHLQYVESLLKHAGLRISDLGCGVHPPIDSETREQLTQANLMPDKRHHNCSGKHAGMLLCCQHHGWPLESYLEPEHPLQQAILKEIQTMADLSEPPPVAVDGCGAPVSYLPLAAMALAYGRLGILARYEPIIKAMTQNPILIGGHGRVDTAIMQASDGKLLAKVGADGLMCISRLKTGQGLALKIADGSDWARDRVTVAVLTQLGWLSAAEAENPLLTAWTDTAMRNSQGKITGQWQVMEVFT